MSNTLHEMTQDIQVRIRELAYLMWEAAGRQQGMAMEYWLRAESEVLFTLQAAASRLMPGSRPDVHETVPALTVSDPSPAAASDAADAPGPITAMPSTTTATSKDTGTPAAAAKKPAARKASARSKVGA